MAEAVVRFVLEKLANFALNKALELYQVSDQVDSVQRELRLIQVLLIDADFKQKTNQSVREWINQVRDVAYRIENAIDTFLVEIETNPFKSSLKETECCSCFSKLRRVGKHPLKLYKLGDDLKEIREDLKTIYQRRIDLGITVLAAGREENDQPPFRPTEPFHINDSEVVGLDTDKSQIISHLQNKNISKRTVLSIVGIGGLGKTTLAQKVYKSAELERQFDCCTWLSISQEFDVNELWRKILYSIDPTMRNNNPPITDEDLPMKLESSLSCKRYLIILDDVWSVDLWERLKAALPDSNNASRVLITSRFHNVARVADCNTEPHLLACLNDDESLALLFRKALQQHIQPDNYPPNLVNVAKQLTTKCDGLPLALVVLGGMLATRERNHPAWIKVYDMLDWHDGDGEKCSRVLAMSFQDLHYELKQCFLYFAAFPEDHKISAKHVTRMWIAENLVPTDGAGTLEDQAEAFLEELVQRCLVQVIEKYWNGYSKSCSMHDLLRDLAIHEAKKDNFFTVFSKERDGNQLPPSSVMRRATLQFYAAAEFDFHSTNTRSLLCFGKYISNYQGLRLLKVLVIEGIDMSPKNSVFKNWLENMVHLRYLGFRNCREMPIFGNISFSVLKNLETLDCRKTKIGDNHSLWSVPTLRHVIISISSMVRCPLKWDDLRNLQTLKWVRLVDVPKLECNVNLRTLKIHDANYESIEGGWQRLKALLLRTEHLVSLTVKVLFGRLPFFTVGTSEFSCHAKIQYLWLHGEWARDLCVPCVKMFPKNLTELRLLSSLLEEDPMPVLEKLQSLSILQLWKNSYIGTKLVCSTGGFPSLKKLELKNLPNLSQWEIKEGAMSILTHLKIAVCGKLHALPELQNAPSLQELNVAFPSVELHRRLQSEFLYRIKHIPSVRIEN